MVAPAPIVTAHTGVVGDRVENSCQLRHVRHDLTGLLVLPHTSIVCDAWYVAEEVIRVLARRHQAGIRRLKKPYRPETALWARRHASGWPPRRQSPHLAGETRVPLIPAQATRPVIDHEQTAWGCSRAVRLVVSCAQEAATGYSVVLVPNRVTRSAALISARDLYRGPTATFD